MHEALRKMFAGLDLPGLGSLDGLVEFGEKNPLLSAILGNSFSQDANPEDDDSGKGVTRIVRCPCGRCEGGKLIVVTPRIKKISRVRKLKHEISLIEKARVDDAEMNAYMLKIFAGEEVSGEPEILNHPDCIFIRLSSIIYAMARDHYSLICDDYSAMEDGPAKETFLVRIKKLKSILDVSPEEFNQWLLNEFGKPEAEGRDPLMALTISISRSVFSYAVSVGSEHDAANEQRLEKNQTELKSLLNELGVKEGDPMFDNDPEIQIRLQDVAALFASMGDKNANVEHVIAMLSSMDPIPKVDESVPGESADDDGSGHE